jgi:hypothetical protein
MTIQSNMPDVLFGNYELKNTPQPFTKSPPIALSKTYDKIADLEIESFLCPISLDKFVDPVVDRCGHTFSKAYIESYCKMKSVDGKIFPCPIDRSNLINIDDFKPNYTVVAAMDESNKAVSDSYKGLSDRISSLEAKIELQFKQSEIDKKTFEAKSETDKKDFENKMFDLYSDAKQLKLQRKIRHQQVENFRNMSLFDRISIVFFYSYAETIQNRGLDELDHDDLKERVSLKRHCVKTNSISF